MPFYHRGNLNLLCFFLLKEFSSHVSSYWRSSHHTFLLIERTLCILLLRDFPSFVSSYWRSFLCPSWRDFITCFFLLKRFYHLFLLIEGIFLCLFADLLLDQFNPVLSHWHIPGILLQFLDLLLRHQLQNIVYFINFFMFKGMGPLSVAETVQESYPQGEAVCLRYQGKGLSYIWDWKISSTSQGKEQIAKFHMPIFVCL